MNLDDRKNEEIDMLEEYEMIPFEPTTYGYDKMNMTPCMGRSRGMETNPSIEVDPNISMHPYMEMDPDIATNSWMETSQFNEEMFMSGFNEAGMMYGDISIKDTEDENEGLRHMDMHRDPEAFKDGYDRPDKFNMKHNDVDSIVRRIERYNPLVFRLLNRCGMPYAQAKGLVRRIVRLTLMYSEE